MSKFGRTERRQFPLLHSQLSRGEGAAGYAAVDALVAMTVLGSTIVFAMAAVHLGLSAARAAIEVREAGELERGLLDGASVAMGGIQGRSGLFAWRVDVGAPVLSSGAATLCRHTATVTSLMTQRSYSLSTDEICASGAQS